MGFGKSLKKAIKKVTKVVSKVADPAGVLGSGGSEEKATEAPAAEVKTPVAAPAPVVAAANVDAPKETGDGEDDADTEAAKKAARAKGKRGLSVARSAGTGINI